MIAERKPAEVAAHVEEEVRHGVSRVDLLSIDGGGPLDLERLGAARYAAGRDADLRLVLNGTPAAATLDSALREFRARLRRR